MSPPAPWIVQVPLLSDWVPTGVGLPMSEQLHPVGQPLAGVTATESKVAVLIEAAWEVTASPANIDPLMLRATVDPEMSVQLTPLVEVYALRLVPVRVTCRYVGGAPATWAAMLALAPAPVRYCTMIPLPGAVSSAEQGEFASV